LTVVCFFLGCNS